MNIESRKLTHFIERDKDGDNAYGNGVDTTPVRPLKEAKNIIILFPAWNAQPRRTDQRFFHVTLCSAMERFSWNAVNVAYRIEKNLGTPLGICNKIIILEK